ncbi:MAG: tetratricopeptide repeat protein [Planctomycetota bacterium]|jgi:tetratricopeptide (TPR) repeat protein
MSDWFDAESHADRALEMYERGRWAEAEAELRKALSLNPDQPEWLFNLGLTLEASGRDTDALDAYERAVDLMPGQVDPLIAAGIVCNRLNQHDRAIEWFDQALRLDPRSETAYANKMESHLRGSEHDDVETTFYLAQLALDEIGAPCLAVMAESLIERRQWERAEWCLREALRLDPTMPRLRARLAAVYAATGRPRRASQLFLRDLRDDPGNIDTLLDYGELLLDQRRLPEASEKFRRVLEMEPANIDAHYRLGQTSMAGRRYEQASIEFELVLKLDPQFPSIRLALGEALLRRGDRDSARNLLLEQLEIVRRDDSPTRHARLGRLGRLLLEIGRAAEAAELFERAVTISGPSTSLLRSLALAQFRAGDRAAGQATSRRVLKLEPACVASMHNLALAALEERRFGEASRWIVRGLACDHQDVGLRRLRMRLWLARLSSVLAWRGRSR